MNLLDAIFQGILQGLTEFLPVSSSGHLAIYQHITGITENNLAFSVMLHIGTLAAVVTVYIKLIIKLFASVVSIIKKIFKRQFKWSEMTAEENLAMMIFVGLLPLFLLFLPIPGTGLKLKDLADKFTQDGYFFIVGLSLVTTGLLLFFGNKKQQQIKVIDGKRYRKKKRKRYTVADAIVVGVTQCAAAICPGLSRSGSTLAASQLRGLDKRTALDYSFLLGTPAILAAAVLEIKDVFSSEGGFSSINPAYVVIGMVCAGLVGFFAILLFRWLLSTNRMYIFILYTAGIGLTILLISIIELASGANLFTQQPLNF